MHPASTEGRLRPTYGLVFFAQSLRQPVCQLKLGKPEKHTFSEPTAKIWHGRRRAGGEAEVGL